MDFGNVFSRAWRICWNNKYLFVLGFLAALGSSSAGGFQGFSGGSGNATVPPAAAENLERIMALIGPILAVLACLGLFLGIIFWLIRLTAQAGLIKTAARLDRGETSSLRQSLSAGRSYLSRFVGLNIVVFLPILILFVISIGAAAGGFAGGLASYLTVGGNGDAGALPTAFVLIALCGLALACILAPILAVASIVYAFAQRGIALQELGVMDSLRHAWRFVRENIGEILLLVIFLVVISIIFGGVVSIVTIPLSLLALGPVFIDMMRGGSVQTLNLIFAGIGFVVLLLVGAALNSLFIAFRSVAVTLSYQDLMGKAAIDEAPGLKPELQ